MGASPIHDEYPDQKWVSSMDGALGRKKEMLFASGQLPKFENQQFKVLDDENENTFYLIPTAEVSLNALHADEIFAQRQDLPLKICLLHLPALEEKLALPGL